MIAADLTITIQIMIWALMTSMSMSQMTELGNSAAEGSSMKSLRILLDRYL